MNNPEHLVSICHFLKKHHVLALCAMANGDMWSANCFYVFNEPAMSLYIMTEHKTRHGALMVSNPFVVGTIANQPKTVALIQGIQYSAQAQVLAGEAERVARSAYCALFPVAKAIPAPVWQLVLQEIKMTDNKLGFGKKLLWQREN
ncbi:YhbP family protein [Edaphovirga cremea]|uniref:YhbP family protein n=1 Tax=Edaphovirga cremea TaxID=2267246 RepID=UPI0039894604